MEPEQARQGFCIWLTGLPSAGKTTISHELAPRLVARGWRVELLDGDEVRRGLSSDLGFDRAAREQHAKRVTFVAKVLARNGVIPIVALISPYATSRALARQEVGRFVEVYIRTPVEVCEQRDVKGLYKKALAGEIKSFTGVSDPYEEPLNPELVVDSSVETVDQSLGKLIGRLEELNYIYRGGRR